ncbi:hypothetical protein ACFX13_014147 [Malus domestica]|uniref:EF-hand domain-containing protein n=1 Tax=Malus domestica TaxID=3750 RepID=A0A498I292_MALDO|nr:hypothetical protein DVH24_019192 [Malus domestica]
MQQIRETALACYDGFSEDRKDKAYAIFETMDSDGDGTVSLYEYEEFFGSSDRTSFQQLDANGDGKLDFEEFITLFYIILTSKGSIMSPPVIKAQPKPSQSNQVSRSRSSRTELVLEAINTFNSGWSFGNAIASTASTAGLCTIM